LGTLRKSVAKIVVRIAILDDRLTIPQEVGVTRIENHRKGALRKIREMSHRPEAGALVREPEAVEIPQIHTTPVTPEGVAVDATLIAVGQEATAGELGKISEVISSPETRLVLWSRLCMG
jgi:hypothetical protein